MKRLTASDRDGEGGVLEKVEAPSLHQKVAALLHSLVRNHALIDGNKRLGWVAAVVLFELNGYLLEAPDDEAYDLVTGVAEGRLDVPEVAAVLEGWAHEAGH